MKRPENFNTLTVEERTQIIQEEIQKIENGKTHNAHTVKRLRNRRLEIHNILNPDSAIVYSQSEHGSNVSEHGDNVGEQGINVSEHGDNFGKSNVSEHGSNVSSDVSVNATTGMTDFNEFLNDPEIANYNKIEYFKERYLYLQKSKFKLIFFH